MIAIPQQNGAEWLVIVIIIILFRSLTGNEEEELETLAEELRPYTEEAMKMELAPLDQGLRGGNG